jgi:hypothetical protein
MKIALYAHPHSVGVCYDCFVVELGGSHVVPCAKRFQHVCRIMSLCVCCAVTVVSASPKSHTVIPATLF